MATAYIITTFLLLIADHRTFRRSLNNADTANNIK